MFCFLVVVGTLVVISCTLVVVIVFITSVCVVLFKVVFIVGANDVILFSAVDGKVSVVETQSLAVVTTLSVV